MTSSYNASCPADPACSANICSKVPSCCSNEWGPECTLLATDICYYGEATCCQCQYGGKGCLTGFYNDTACNDIICDARSSCCSTWDDKCSDMAVDYCVYDQAPTTTVSTCCDCVFTSSYPGCFNDYECESIVCGANYDCCMDGWNTDCKNDAEKYCFNQTFPLPRTVYPSPYYPYYPSSFPYYPIPSPTPSPTDEPTSEPSNAPSNYWYPSFTPDYPSYYYSSTTTTMTTTTTTTSREPTYYPTNAPTDEPSKEQISTTVQSTNNPTTIPTNVPTNVPIQPSIDLTTEPTANPVSIAPTHDPTSVDAPSQTTIVRAPSSLSSPPPTTTISPSQLPSNLPSALPTASILIVGAPSTPSNSNGDANGENGVNGNKDQEIITQSPFMLVFIIGVGLLCLFAFSMYCFHKKMKWGDKTHDMMTMEIEFEDVASVSVKSPSSIEDEAIFTETQETHAVASALPDTSKTANVKPIEKWDIDDVYEWLSQVHDGQLKELAQKFKNARIRGRGLAKITNEHLTNIFDTELGDQLQFDDARKELFEKHG